MSRRFQFSLKWLFVAMLVVAAFFAGLHLGHRGWLQSPKPRKMKYVRLNQWSPEAFFVPDEDSESDY
jgi:hypothetical protein